MSLRQRIQDLFVEKPSASLSRSQIAAELDLSRVERRALEGVLASLKGAGELEIDHRRYRLAKPLGAVVGVFHSARGGFGFITPETGRPGQDLFVPARHTLGAFEGDRVAAALAPRRGGTSPEARVTKVLSRSRQAVVGIVQGGYLLPMGSSLPPISVEGRGAKEGEVAAVVLEAEEGGAPRAASLASMGALDDPQTPIRAAEARFGLSREFPAEAAAEAGRLPSEPDPADFEGRTDFRGLPTVTIDPEDARDFDDAISVKAEGQGFRLWVHIADVSHYVRPGSALDGEARRRGNSTYLPGTVYPMLPHALSSNLCSLVPHRERLTFTAELRIDGHGETREARFHKGVIRSMARLSYEEAQGLLEGKGSPEPEVLGLLERAHALFKTLFARRLRLGTLDLDMPEADLRFGLTGKVEEVLPATRLDSHRIVEEAMLAANEAVARELERRQAPCLYRVHEPPNAEKLEALRPLLNALGLGAASRGDLTDPFALQRLLEASQGHRAAKLVAYLVLRAMAQARYSPDLMPHYGLGFQAYCHFTSPIRRYPDLLVHRSLGAEVFGGAGLAGDLEAAAAHCSRTERTSDLAEREVLAWYQMAFLAARLGETFDAMVLGFSRFGVRVELVDHLIEGVCPFQVMAQDYITVDRDGLGARGRYSGAVLKVGEMLPVRLVRVDRLAGEAHFVPEDWPGEGRSGRGGVGARGLGAGRPPKRRPR